MLYTREGGGGKIYERPTSLRGSPEGVLSLNELHGEVRGGGRLSHINEAQKRVGYLERENRPGGHRGGGSLIPGKGKDFHTF